MKMLRFRGDASALLNVRGEISTYARAHRIAIIYRVTSVDFEDDSERSETR